MAIRLRIVNEEMVALCAAKSSAKEGDVYLDDSMHYALTCKFAREWDRWNEPVKDALTEAEETDNGRGNERELENCCPFHCVVWEVREG